ATNEATDPKAVICSESCVRIVNTRCQLSRAGEGGPRFFGAKALGPSYRSAVAVLQLQPLARRCGATGDRRARRRLAGFVGHLERLAQMGDRLLEGSAAQRLVARLAPPFDRCIGETGLSEVMRQNFRLACRLVDEAITRSLGDAPMQNLPPALQEILISRV